MGQVSWKDIEPQLAGLSLADQVRLVRNWLRANPRSHLTCEKGFFQWASGMRDFLLSEEGMAICQEPVE